MSFANASEGTIRRFKPETPLELFETPSLLPGVPLFKLPFFFSVRQSSARKVTTSIPLKRFDRPELDFFPRAAGLPPLCNSDFS